VQIQWLFGGGEIPGIERAYPGRISKMLNRIARGFDNHLPFDYGR
jgi:hypothetical protein